MRLDRFIERRRPLWLELEGMLLRASRGRLRNLSTTELERFGALYRHTSSDLAIVRRDHPNDPLAHYLNGLCARVHPLVHGGSRGPGARARVADVYKREIPRAFREALPHIATSALLLLAGLVAGWLAVQLRPDLRPSLIPSSLFDELARGEHRGPLPDPAAVSPVIILNNVRVALLLFAGGVLIGAPTALALLVNGWILGTLAAAVADGGYSLQFWALIAPHGVIELSIIVISGGAGLLLGDSILRPGLRTRGDALAEAARRTVWLALGAGSLLVVAGLLEGYVSPSGLPAGAKYGIGLASGVLLYWWLLGSGRPLRTGGRPLRTDEGPVRT